MPQYLTTHKNNGVNDALEIEVVDEPGAGGAPHHYLISGFDTTSNKSDPFVAKHGQPGHYATILFQNGPIGEVGVNGITHEVLLAILIDRMEAFQRGPYACDFNDGALKNLEAALAVLEARTRERVSRGVEGTHEQ